MKSWVLYSLMALALAGCKAQPPASAPTAQTLTVSAAASLKDAFTEIGDLYRANSGKIVSFNFGASGALQKQIEAGAPVDVFASAGAKQMDEIEARGLIERASRRDFARNALALIVPADSTLQLSGFTDLASAEVQKIAVGNPKTVPAGQYTEEVFDYFQLRGSVQAKLITAEDVRQVLDYVRRGEVDVGLVYLTDAKTAARRVQVLATAPEASHAPILYPIAIMKESQHQRAAEEFVSLVTGAEGRRILQQYGFTGIGDR